MAFLRVRFFLEIVHIGSLKFGNLMQNLKNPQLKLSEKMPAEKVEIQIRSHFVQFYNFETGSILGCSGVLGGSVDFALIFPGRGEDCGYRGGGGAGRMRKGEVSIEGGSLIKCSEARHPLEYCVLS
jgi:hypothetical protein